MTEVSIHATLARIEAQIALLRHDVAVIAEGHKPAPALSLADRIAMQAVLQAVAAGTLRDVVFTAGDALEFIRSSPLVVEALEGAIGVRDAGAPRRLGKLFARAVGADLDGLAIERVGEVRGGVLWVVRVSNGSSRR